MTKDNKPLEEAYDQIASKSLTVGDYVAVWYISINDFKVHYLKKTDKVNPNAKLRYGLITGKSNRYPGDLYIKIFGKENRSRLWTNVNQYLIKVEPKDIPEWVNTKKVYE